MSKPHIYRVNGKWYCKRKCEDGFGGAGIYRTALGVARDTPNDAFAAWYEFHEGNKLATFGLRGL